MEGKGERGSPGFRVYNSVGVTKLNNFCLWCKIQTRCFLALMKTIFVLKWFFYQFQIKDKIHFPPHLYIAYTDGLLWRDASSAIQTSWDYHLDLETLGENSRPCLVLDSWFSLENCHSHSQLLNFGGGVGNRFFFNFEPQIEFTIHEPVVYIRPEFSREGLNYSFSNRANALSQNPRVLLAQRVHKIYSALLVTCSHRSSISII